MPGVHWLAAWLVMRAMSVGVPWSELLAYVGYPFVPVCAAVVAKQLGGEGAGAPVRGRPLPPMQTQAQMQVRARANNLLQQRVSTRTPKTPPPKTPPAPRPLTVTLGLKHHTLEAVKQLVAAVKEQGLLR